MTIMDIEKEVELFLDEKLDKRMSAEDFYNHSNLLLNLIITLYNKYDVRITAQDAWTILHSKARD